MSSNDPWAWENDKAIFDRVFPGAVWIDANAGKHFYTMGPFLLFWSNRALGLRVRGGTTLWLLHDLDTPEKLEKAAIELREEMLGWAAGIEMLCGGLSEPEPAPRFETIDMSGPTNVLPGVPLGVQGFGSYYLCMVGMFEEVIGDSVVVPDHGFYKAEFSFHAQSWGVEEVTFGIGVAPYADCSIPVDVVDVSERMATIGDMLPDAMWSTSPILQLNKGDQVYGLISRDGVGSVECKERHLVLTPIRMGRP